MYMNDVMGVAERLANRPDLFPWVVLGLLLIFFFSQQKKIVELFEAVIASHRARVKYYDDKEKTDAKLAEVIRSNTTALDNNTEALRSVINDRGETRMMVSHHEELSKERDRSILEVANRIDRTVTSNSARLGLIDERTDKLDAKG